MKKVILNFLEVFKLELFAMIFVMVLAGMGLISEVYILLGTLLFFRTEQLQKVFKKTTSIETSQTDSNHPSYSVEYSLMIANLTHEIANNLMILKASLYASSTENSSTTVEFSQEDFRELEDHIIDAENTLKQYRRLLDYTRRDNRYIIKNSDINAAIHSALADMLHRFKGKEVKIKNSYESETGTIAHTDPLLLRSFIFPILLLTIYKSAKKSSTLEVRNEEEANQVTCSLNYIGVALSSTENIVRFSKKQGSTNSADTSLVLANNFLNYINGYLETSSKQIEKSTDYQVQIKIFLPKKKEL